MNIAFLFNSDHEIYNGYYGGPILELVLKSNILQTTNRNIKVSVGDILTFSATSESETPTYDYFYKLNKKVYTPYKFNHLIQPKLENISKKSTIYCIFFQNILQNTAISLHNKLKNNDSYLGSMDINLNNQLHARFFKYSLITNYRIFNKECSIFYSMNDNEDPDISEKEYFEKYNFKVNYEDLGAVDTIFDNYYANYKHLSRIQDFKDIFLTLPNVNDDILDNIIISLEELHPKLFNSFAALSRTYARIETEEDIAQCSLSGRRILEQLADHLFPPREMEHNGRKVGKSQYKNRLWAYITDVVNIHSIDKKNITNIGKQIDCLVDNFNAGLHSDYNKNELIILIEKLIFFIIDLVNLSPSSIRRPYLAYDKEISNFMEELQYLD